MSRDIPVTLIDPDPDQPRKHFDRAAGDELAQSMQTVGLASPILVRPAGERFLIIHGERRWRAARSLSWETIPAIIRDIPADEAGWLALIENIQRADLTPIEEAEAYQARLTGGLTQEELGRRVGKSQSAIAQKLRLLTLPEPIALYVRRGALSEGHARQLLKLRGWYHGLICTFGGMTGDAGAAERRTLGDQIFVLATTIGIRPEDAPARGFVPLEEEATTALLADACSALWARIEARAGAALLWEIHAFWYATFAVYFDVGVADLAKVLDGWRRRFLSMIAWRVTFGQGTRPAHGVSRLGDLELGIWYGHTSDLRHARLAPQFEAGTLPDELRGEAAAFIEEEGAIILPSNWQPWGQQHADACEWQSLINGETEESAAAARPIGGAA